MPFAIKHPAAGTAAALNMLPKKFVAWGTKDRDAQVPLGVVYSTKNDGTPDGKRMIGGVPLPGARLGDTRWALFFNIPKTKPNDRHTLLVLDAKALPTTITAAGALKADYLGFKRRERTGFAPPAKRKTDDFDAQLRELLTRMAVDYPLPTSTVGATEFLSYGILPSGDYDINGAETKVVNQANQSETAPDWSWTDGTGFWAAFWPALAAGPVVDLYVTYLPSGTDEIIRDITLG